jgi:SAM-dependent methyltransferase
MSTRGIRAQLLQSDEEWAARNAILSRHLADLINEYAAPGAIDGIEVGCQHGALIEQMHRLTRVRKWTGIDPTLTEETVTDSGCTLRPGRASQLGFPDGTFDVAVFANVFEHIPPGERDPSLREIYRVLKSGGVVVGQLPNALLPDRVPQPAPVHGLAAEQVAAPVLEAGAACWNDRCDMCRGPGSSFLSGLCDHPRPPSWFLN